MKNSDKSQRRNLMIICVALIVFASLPLISRANSFSVSVNIVNNSNHEIRNVYTSHVGADDWSDDQLGESTLPVGQSRTITVACDQQQAKIIGEDDDGCFVTTAVSCGSNSTWTITADAPRDCGN